jgi:hypothetical protein
MLHFKYFIIIILIQDKLIMFIKGSNSSLKKEVKRFEILNVFKTTLNFTLKDLKIKLLNEFNKNKSKLNPFLV